jgi:hypothetical protein
VPITVNKYYNGVMVRVNDGGGGAESTENTEGNKGVGKLRGRNGFSSRICP